MIDVMHIFSQMFVIVGIIVCFVALIKQTQPDESFEGLLIIQAITGFIGVCLLIEFFVNNDLCISYFDLVLFSIFIGCLVSGVITKEYTNKCFILFLSIIAVLVIFRVHSGILEINRYLGMIKQDISQLSTREKFKLVNHIKVVTQENRKNSLYDDIKKQVEEELSNSDNKE